MNPQRTSYPVFGGTIFIVKKTTQQEIECALFPVLLM